jgi:hypothetical protein
MELRDASSGALLKSVPLSSGVSTVSHRAAEDLVLRAFDASGALVGTGVFPLPRSTATPEWEMPETTENWSSGA